MTEVKEQPDSPFNQPFSLAKVIWSFLLKTPISIGAGDVKINSCQPNRDGLFDGWNCILESTHLSETLLQTEAKLLDEFRKIPDDLISQKQINNRKLPKLIKERQRVSLTDFRSHWQSVVQYPHVQVTLTDPVGLGMCQPQSTRRGPVNISLQVKGVWVTQTKLGLYVEMSSFQNETLAQ